MKVLQIGVVGMVLVSLASCSTLASDGKRIDYGAAASQVPSLELPPDLTTPSGDDRYKIPQAGGEGATSYSDFSKGGGAGSTPAVLPVVPLVHMEHNDNQRWLVVNDKAENVWPRVKAFWAENGLTIKSADPVAGVMETDWAENRAKFRQTGSQSEGDTSRDDSVYSVGERDQYTTRLERSKDGMSTEVYISQRGMEELFSQDKRVPKWEPRGNDPEREAIMLQRLMAYFGVDKTRAAKEVAAASMPVAVSAPAGASGVAATGTVPPAVSEPAGSASLRENADGSTFIMINDPFDRSWRKVGLAIDSAGIGVEDKDRDKGIYYLKPVKLERGWLDKLKFWKNSEDTVNHYRVIVKDGGTSCNVSIVDQNGVSNKVSKQMLEAIYKNISPQQ
jgi:outer membrane protein assembly factor BamC